MYEVSCLAEELLDTDQLPAFYEAKMYTYLSSCDEYNSNDCLESASSALEEAKSELTWIPNEIVDWEVLLNQQGEAMEQYEETIRSKKCGLSEVPIEGLSLDSTADTTSKARAPAAIVQCPESKQSKEEAMPTEEKDDEKQEEPLTMNQHPRMPTQGTMS